MRIVEASVGGRMPTTPARILVCADSAAALADVQPVLAHAGYEIGFHALCDEGKALAERDGACALVVVDGSRLADAALKLCHRLRGRLGENYVPILYLTSDSSPRARLASLESGADTYLLRPFE